MFTGMLRFEWRYHVHRMTFALIALVVCFMALAMVKTAYGADATHINSPYAVMQACGLLSLWTLFGQTIFCVNGTLRDDEHGMRELIHSRPVSRLRLLASRYAGMVMAGMTVMLLAVLVLIIAPVILPVDSERLGPMRPLVYGWSLLTLILPDVVLVSALLFAVAAFARSTLSTYVGGIAIFALYTVVLMLTGSPVMAGSAPPTAEGIALAAVIDPFGLAAVFEQTRYWTPAERNVRMVSLTGKFLLNRVLWLTVASLVLLCTYRFTTLGAWRSASPRARRRGAPRRGSQPLAHDAVPVAIAYAPVPPSAQAGLAFGSALRSATALEIRLVLSAWTFRVVMLLWMLVFGVDAVASLDGGEYGTRLLATSSLLVAGMGQPLSLIGTLCLIYFGAEVVWRESAVAVDTLIDATPASNGVFYLSKLFALCAIPLILAGVGVLVAVVLQVANRGLDIQPRVYLAQFWFIGAPLLLFAVAAVALQVLTANRWTGMLATLLLTVVTRTGAAFGLEHPMLRYGAVPAVSHSDVDGFGSSVLSFSAFMAYWTSFALLLGIVSWGAWRRGRDAGAWTRITRLWRREQKQTRPALLAAFGAVVLASVLLFRETNVAHAWSSTENRLSWNADYERSYRRLAERAQPSVVHAELAVDFEPSRRRATIHGTLTVRNRTDAAIDSVWVQMRRDVEDDSVSIEGAQQMSLDTRFRMRVFAMDTPLQPGDSARLHYALSLDRGGIRADGFAQDVASNGSYLAANTVLPALGYRAGYEISDLSERRKRGLGDASVEPSTPGAIDSLARLTRRTGAAPAWITLRAVLSSTDGQTALGPGRLVRTWQQGDRRYAEYRVDSRMPAVFASAAGRFAVTRMQHGPVQIEFWHHPAHASNIDAMLAAAARTLDVMGARFGPYGRETLRMVEVPSGWPFGAFATPGMLFFTENRGTLSDPRREDVDLLTRRVAHEVAHQWWGHAVSPLNVPGSATIVESLAKYAEQLVVEAVHGSAALPAMLAFDHERYLVGRGTDAAAEPTLLSVTDQPHIYYGKGALAVHALRDALGDSAMTHALAMLVSREGGPFGAATAAELQVLLRAVATSDASRALVDEWFAERVLYDLRADTAVAEKIESGYRVRAVFRVVRVSLGENGEVATSAQGAFMEVRMIGADGTPMHSASVPVANGRVVVTADVPTLPEAIEIDPRLLRIDRDRSNNRLPVSLVRP